MSTPLQSACSVGSIAIVKRLLKSGARVDVMNEAHNSPLHLASSGGHEDVSLTPSTNDTAYSKESSLEQKLCSK